MSYIYFHSPIRDARVKGSERMRFRDLCGNIALSQFDIESFADTTDNIKRKELFCLLSSFGKDDHLRRYEVVHHHYAEIRDCQWNEFKREWELRFKYGDEFTLFNKIDNFQLKLNTAYLLGSNAVKLAARIDGQCEIHCWVKGENRIWLSEIIKSGLNAGIYQPDKGWEDVIDLLTSEQDNPVVLSYSVCDQFPNSKVSEWDDSDDAFYELDSATRWELGMTGLRNLDHKLLELSPDNWNTFYFNQGWDIIKLSQLLHIGALSDEPLTTIRRVIARYESSSSNPQLAWEEAKNWFFST